jgi:hypothetical protein
VGRSNRGERSRRPPRRGLAPTLRRAAGALLERPAVPLARRDAYLCGPMARSCTPSPRRRSSRGPNWTPARPRRLAACSGTATCSAPTGS